MIGFLRGFVIFIGAMFVQWWWNTHFAYWGAAPQFLLVLTILIAARRGAVLGMLAGFGWGLYLDVARAELFGASALTLTLAAYFVGIIRRFWVSSGPARQIVDQHIMKSRFDDLINSQKLADFGLYTGFFVKFARTGLSDRFAPLDLTTRH